MWNEFAKTLFSFQPLLLVDLGLCLMNIDVQSMSWHMPMPLCWLVLFKGACIAWMPNRCIDTSAHDAQMQIHSRIHIYGMRGLVTSILVLWWTYHLWLTICHGCTCLTSMFVKLAYLARCTALPFQKMVELAHHVSCILFIVMFVVPFGLHHLVFLFFVTFIDDFTRCTWIFALKSKLEVFTCSPFVIAIIEAETSLKIANMKTDWEGEYMSKEFHDFMAARGIHH